MNYCPQQVSLQLPPGSCPVGVVYLELMNEQSHLLGGGQGRPLLLLPSADAAKEACRQLPGSSSVVPSSIGDLSAASSPFFLDLACWMEEAASDHALTSADKTGNSSPFTLVQTRASSPSHLEETGMGLLCHAIKHSLSGCAIAIMDVLTAQLGSAPEELFHSVSVFEWDDGPSDLIDPPSLLLLHLAARKGSLPVLHSLLAWAEAKSVRPDWSAAGPSGICPLHMATLLPNAEEVLRGLMGLPHPHGPDVAAAWLLCRTFNGRTPAELGSTLGLPASLDSLAREALIKASEEDEPRSSGGPAVRHSASSGGDGAVAVAQITYGEAAFADAMSAPSCAADSPYAAAAAREEESALGESVAQDDDGDTYCSFKSVGQPGDAGPSAADFTVPNELWRLLLWGFPDAGVEERYTEFKVSGKSQVSKAWMDTLIWGGGGAGRLEPKSHIRASKFCIPALSYADMRNCMCTWIVH